MNYKTLIKISRPRFWLYAGGTFLVGAMAGAPMLTSLLEWRTVVYLVYFMVPANIFIYGINDLYDDDTDSSNPKKQDKEHLLRLNERRSLRWWVAVSMVLGLVLAISAQSAVTAGLFVLFLFLAWAYSSKPFRFKAHPFIDAISNVHYAVIGFVGYSLYTGSLPPWWAIVAAWCWTASMHIYSAVPDIASDAAARLRTTAVVLGARTALAVCIVLWVVTTILVLQYFFVSPLVCTVLVYPVMGVYTLVRLDQLSKLYWLFPYINAVVGFVLFLLVAWY